MYCVLVIYSKRNVMLNACSIFQFVNNALILNTTETHWVTKEVPSSNIDVHESTTTKSEYAPAFVAAKIQCNY